MAEHADHSEHHDVTKALHDVPPNKKLLIMVIGTCVVLVVSVLAIVEYFEMSVRAEQERKVLSQPSAQLLSLRQKEDLRLKSYAWVDQKKGVVRVPLERAIELTLRDWDKRPEGLVEWKDVPPAPAAPAAPAPGGAAPAPAPATPTPAPAPQSPPPPKPGAPKQ